MDQACFEAWLLAIRSLTAEQRGVGFRNLALAEAAEGEDLAACILPTGAAVSAMDDNDRSVAEEPAGKLSDGPVMVEPVSLAAAAARKVSLTGCPHCASQQLQRWGSANGLPRYRCTACRRSFNALTGTPLARLRKKEQWPAQAEALVTGESLVKAAERCEIAVTTAFRWRHRFLEAAALDKPIRLDGIVEADETFILESFKGRRVGLSRPARKRGGTARKRGLSAEQIPVLVGGAGSERADHGCGAAQT
ncbi:MAG: IS1 family transposase [Rhodospirillales bacterium]|nr:IS1 family transposase [Rhodospirillales bacterium]